MNNESNKLSLAECRKIFAGGDPPFTDEELIKIRDWVDNLIDIALIIIEQNGIDNINAIIDEKNKNDNK